jgi:hypothetical protein
VLDRNAKLQFREELRGNRFLLDTRMSEEVARKLCSSPFDALSKQRLDTEIAVPGV